MSCGVGSEYGMLGVDELEEDTDVERDGEDLDDWSMNKMHKWMFLRY